MVGVALNVVGIRDERTVCQLTAKSGHRDAWQGQVCNDVRYESFNVRSPNPSHTQTFPKPLGRNPRTRRRSSSPTQETSNSGYADAMAVSPIREAKTMQYHEFVCFALIERDVLQVLLASPKCCVTSCFSDVNHAALRGLRDLGQRTSFTLHSDSRTLGPGACEDFLGIIWNLK